MVTLKKLLTDEEYRLIDGLRQCSFNMTYYNKELEMNIANMPVKILKEIALVLISTEYKGKTPECFLAAEAINILSKRAMEKNLSIFD